MKNKLLYGALWLMWVAVPAVAQNSTENKNTIAGEAIRDSTVKMYPTRMVKGSVMDETTHLPIAGVIVCVADVEGFSTISEADGTYSLKIPFYASQLQFSAPQMNPIRMGILEGEQQRIAYLYPNSFTDEYASGNNVLGVRTAPKFDYSYAVSSEEDIQRLLGADVHTVLRNGTSGIGGTMFMNGLNSLHVNAQPLIVVDGVIFDQQYNRTMIHQGFYNNILTGISPNDIEKVTVLKNGTSLYGAKGANGVILIETRRNTSMATRITATISTGVTLEPNYIDMMDATQYKSYASDLLSTTNTSITAFKFLNENPDYYYYPFYHNNTDWKKKVYRTAIDQNYNINVGGGDEVANYNLSLGYVDRQSTLVDNDMDRINIRFNTDIKFTGKLATRFDVSFSKQTRNLRNDGAPENYSEGTPTSPSFLAYVKSPMLSPYTYSGGIQSNSFIDVGDESYLDEALAQYNNYNYKLANPVAINQYGHAENKNFFETSIINIAIAPRYTFNDYLSLSEHFSYNLVNTSENYYIPMNGVPDYFVSSVNAYRENETRSLASNQSTAFSDTRLDWKRRYGAHAFHVFGGARILWERYSLNTQVGYNTGNDKTPFMSSSLLNADNDGANDNWNSWSWYAQASYDYLQRYFVQLNTTAETSSRFGKNAIHSIKFLDAPWTLFYGLQTSWVVSNEPWFASIEPINYLRLSVGYDVSGNDDIDYYAARSYFRAFKFMESISGVAFDNIGNTQLQSERTQRFNVGLETHLFCNRLGIHLNFFKSKTNNLLTYQSLGYLSGLEYNWSNGGALSNNGFDVSMAGKLVAQKNFQWEVGASVGHYKNEITQLPDKEKAFNTNLYGATIRTEVGQAANLFYGYKTLGVFTTSEEAQAAGLYVRGENGVDKNYFGAGDVHFEDLDNNHEISEGDCVVIGDPNPDFYGNLFSSMSYKRFRLDVNFNYSIGNDVYNYMRCQLESGSRFMNQTTALLRRWQAEGQRTDIPRATFQDPLENNRFSDRWIEDGSYLRLKSVTLSYNLPIQSNYLQGVQLWLQGNNLVTFTNYLGSDPEFTMTSNVIGQGIDLGQLPQCRSLVAGIKINL